MKSRYRLHLACRIVADIDHAVCEANGRERGSLEASPEKAIAQAWQGLANQHVMSTLARYQIVYQQFCHCRISPGSGLSLMVSLLMCTPSLNFFLRISRSTPLESYRAIESDKRWIIYDPRTGPASIIMTGNTLCRLADGLRHM